MKFIGVGEQVDDLQPFDPDAFADALFDNQPDETPAFAEDREALARQEPRAGRGQRQELLEQGSPGSC